MKEKGKPHMPGIPYSSINVDMARGEKSLVIRQRFGALGLAMLYDVIAWINEGKGCWAKWTDQTPFDYAMTRLYDLSLADKAREIFLLMVEIGWFDKEAFRADSVLTSETIVERYLIAKRRPRLDKMPESVRKIAESILEREKDNSANNTPNSANNTPNSANNHTKEKKRKEVQTNRQTTTTEKCSNNSAPIPDQTEAPPATLDPVPDADPVRFVIEAMDDPRWDEVRLRIARMIYSQYLSADLVDLFAAAAVRKWISVPQVRNWVQGAREKSKLYSASRGYAGKAKLWETLRPLLEDVFRAHEMPMPICDPNRREPPPEPDPASSVDKEYDPATRAGRRVMATV
ncbi:MAG: DUF4373 domain-containing protein [Thermoguttaceae bacterium]|nr:DUF4373 domain-containing protein [Thermoguttaceae bacterium]